MVGWAALTKSYDDWGPILMSCALCLPVGVPPSEKLSARFFLLDWHSSPKVCGEKSLFLRNVRSLECLFKISHEKTSISSLRNLTFYAFLLLWFGRNPPTFAKNLGLWHLIRKFFGSFEIRFFWIFRIVSSCGYFVARNWNTYGTGILQLGFFLYGQIQLVRQSL